MADSKITALTANTAPLTTDIFPVDIAAVAGAAGIIYAIEFLD